MNDARESDPRVAGTDASSNAAGDQSFLPPTSARPEAESVFVRLVATAGVVGISTLLGAVLTANNVAGWITGLVVSIVSIVLAAVLWRSRTL